MSLKRAHSPDDSSDHVFRSSSITDRQSIFVAHYSPTLSARALQAHPDFKSATHRIAAWRRPSSQRSVIAHSQRILDTGHDDDGESYAGKKLEKLLEGQKVEGAVCVARWYGGVMLGPVRFEHIENCARQAIHAWRAAATQAEQHKRQKVADAKLKQELERMLAERDQSILVLRSLLAEKRKAAAKDESPPQPPAAAPAKPMDYSKMPVEALRKLEKARDATISFILKEIDKVEALMK
ncbi:ribosomal protein S5 domain 2-type protein, partial [Phyllosticta capitalensis]|uniref:ribosomal protein S5 domain 2-type protein n=1 Tax=Phyllosticta capitalensis TaxID=121624 RepID=UPI00312D4458